MDSSVLGFTTYGVTSALFNSAVLALDGTACHPTAMATGFAKHAWDSAHSSDQQDVDQHFADLIFAVGADDQDFCRVFGDIMDAHRNS